MEPDRQVRERRILNVLCAVWLAIGVTLAAVVLSRPGSSSDDLAREFAVLVIAVFGIPSVLRIISERAGGIGFVLSGVALVGAGLMAFAWQPLLLAWIAALMGGWTLSAFSKLA